MRARKKRFTEGEAQGTTVMTKRDAHIEELVNRSADAIHIMSKRNRISSNAIPGGYIMSNDYSQTTVRGVDKYG